MSKFKSLENRLYINDLLESDLKNCNNLEEAAQKFVEKIYYEFKESVALMRMFVTVPYEELPKSNQTFVAKLARAKGFLSDLMNDTPVLSLIGTKGEIPQWNDRLESKGHIGIPLISVDFIDSIPMISRLTKDLGLNLDWLKNPDKGLSIDVQHDIAGVFFVEDAKKSTDSQNRKIIPAQDFVEEYGIHTVFGIGGRYMLGGRNMVVLILFTKEEFSKDIARRFMPTINLFKIATMKLIIGKKIFAE